MLALLLSMSSMGVVWGFTGGTIHVHVPGTALLEEVKVYGTHGGEGVAVVQEIHGSLECLQGQVIKRHLGLPGAGNVVIELDYASLREVRMYTTQLVSSGGDLENLEIRPRKAREGYLTQKIRNAKMENLGAKVCFISIGYLTYRGLSIRFEP